MEKMLELRMQAQQNNREVSDFLKGLDSWTTDIKKQDDNLKSMKPSRKAASVHPPVRSAPVVEKVKKKIEEQKPNKKDRIRSSDYKKWDKLDVDAMLEEMDEEEKKVEEEVELEVEKLDDERKAKVATEMKQKGNEHFKNAGYLAAIECYTTGMQADPSNPIFPANRAMAYLKLKRHAETEADCTLALSLDPTYTKAYLRRGTARVAMGKLLSAKKDYADALKLEPGNPQAKLEMRKLDKMGDLEKVTNKKQPPKLPATTKKKGSRLVHPVMIPALLRSRKPLMRVEVEEIGIEHKEKKLPTVRNEAGQSKVPVENGLPQSAKNQPPMISEILAASTSSCNTSNATSPPSYAPLEMISSERDSAHAKSHQDIPDKQDTTPTDTVSSVSDKTNKTVKIVEVVPESPKDDTTQVNGDSKAEVEMHAETQEVVDRLSKLETLEEAHLNSDLKHLHGSSRGDHSPEAELNNKMAVQVPPLPSTSFQFQADVKRLSQSPEHLYLYLRQISPTHIPSLLKQQLETETLMPVVHCLHANMNGNDIVFDYLQQFAKVRRFDMAVMFLSDQEKKDVLSLIHDLEKEFPTRMEDTRGLRKRYGV